MNRNSLNPRSSRDSYPRIIADVKGGLDWYFEGNNSGLACGINCTPLLAKQSDVTYDKQ